MASGCIEGIPKRKNTAPLTFKMDGGVICTVFGLENTLCKFADFLFTFFIESYAQSAAGFLIDPLVKVLTDYPPIADYYNSPAGKFDLAIATKAKFALQIVQTAGDVTAALDSLILDTFITDNFCASNPRLTPVPITYQMVLSALIPFGDGFDNLLNAITKNWIIIKFADYCICDLSIPGPTLTPPKPPRFITTPVDCFGDASAQISAQNFLQAIDDQNDLLDAQNQLLYKQGTFLFGLLPFDDANSLFSQYLAENNLTINSENFPGGFAAYYQEFGTEGNFYYNQDPDNLFPIELIVGYSFKTKFYPAKVSNTAGVSYQFYDPGFEPPCNCVGVTDTEILFVKSTQRNALIDGRLNIRALLDTVETQFAPSEEAIDLLYEQNQLEPYFLYPRFILTDTSCPSYIVITDQDLLCADLPDLCNCKKVSKFARVAIRTGCDINDQEDVDIEYEVYEGSTCEIDILEVDVFKKCFKPFQPKMIYILKPPNILT